MLRVNSSSSPTFVAFGYLVVLFRSFQKWAPQLPRSIFQTRFPSIGGNLILSYTVFDVFALKTDTKTSKIKFLAMNVHVK